MTVTCLGLVRMMCGVFFAHFNGRTIYGGTQLDYMYLENQVCYICGKWDHLACHKFRLYPYITYSPPAILHIADNVSIIILLQSFYRYHVVSVSSRLKDKWYQFKQIPSDMLLIWDKAKGKAIPLQAWTGPQGSRRLRLPDFKTIGTWRW